MMVAQAKSAMVALLGLLCVMNYIQAVAGVEPEAHPACELIQLRVATSRW